MTLKKPPEALTIDQRDALNRILVDSVTTKNVARAEGCYRKGASVNCIIVMTVEVPLNNNQPSIYREERRKVPLVHFCLLYYDTEIISTLARVGMEIDALDEDGNTALIKLLKEKEPDATKIETFLTLGANPMHTNTKGENVLYCAYQIPNNHPAREKIIDLLLEKVPDRIPSELTSEFNIHALPVTLDKAMPPAKSISFVGKTENRKKDIPVL